MSLKALSLASMGMTMTPLAAALVAVITTPTTTDAWAAVGASVGSMIVVVDSLKKDRSIMHLACVLASSWFLGLILPAVVVQFWQPSLMQLLSWHAWAGMGFMVSLFGWGITAVILALSPSVSRWVVGSTANRMGIPLPDEDRDPNPKP